MKHATMILMVATAPLLAFSLGGCTDDPEQNGAAMEGHDMDATGGMRGGMEDMTVDPELMNRHAEEMDSAAEDMRMHLTDMRDASPAEWEARMGGHAPQVVRMIRLVERQTREMDAGMDMGDQEMGQMMGMSGDAYRGMMRDLETLRSDIEELQTAPAPLLAERMPEHFERLERMTRMMEESAEHMRMP